MCLDVQEYELEARCFVDCNGQDKPIMSTEISPRAEGDVLSLLTGLTGRGSGAPSQVLGGTLLRADWDVGVGYGLAGS